ncbi:MAG: 16S rRNA (adenine(1518)-N(6)/adenine(1519)-N(6))-dimethyltransferase RsmA [Planctomycetota bacterium]
MTEGASGERAPFARYRERLAALGFRPRRRLGQNFLLDPSLHRVMVETAGVQPADLVLEVGAGCGFLTRELAATGARVVAVEIDPRLHAIVAEDLPSYRDGGAGVRLVHADALGDGGFSAAVRAAVAAELGPDQRLLLVANLPYAASGPLLASLRSLQQPPATAAVLVQLETAERLRAAVGTAAYGSLSITVRASYAVELVRRVGREVFRPRPLVDSAVVRLVLRPDAPSAGTLGPQFGNFSRQLFGARRKRLPNALRRAAAAVGVQGDALGAHQAWADRRPQDLSPDEVVQLWQHVSTLA